MASVRNIGLALAWGFAWTGDGFSVMLLYIEATPAFGLPDGLLFPGFLPGFGLPATSSTIPCSFQTVG
jgi:hypothetical protein